METVFITIHDLSSDARIKYCSESVEYILGYLPHEVKGKSCWDYFHPDELPFAKLIHGQGLGLDRAAVFNYCRVKHKDGTWIGCECVFTVVYDVLIASTAIYHRGPRAQRRANDGAQIRRIFSSSPRDARYNMLSYISNRFYQEPSSHTPEPRAALFLNRFTRTSAIMFATNGVADILGIQPSQLIGKSFYYCIAPNCLNDAIRCLESAKANDSIAYLRFWFRDPTHAQDQPQLADHPILGSDDEDDEGGVSVMPKSPSWHGSQQGDLPVAAENGKKAPPAQISDEQFSDRVSERTPRSRLDQLDTHHSDGTSQSRSSSDESAQTTSDAIFDPPSLQHHPSTASTTPDNEPLPPIELEAVISCTSDGLIVVLRRAKPLRARTTDAPDASHYANGLFASPWATQPILPDGVQKSDIARMEANVHEADSMILGFMDSIRDVAVFAWSLTSINGSLIDHAKGTPTGEALPPAGLPIWDPDAQVDAKENEMWNGFANSTHRRIKDVQPIDDTGIDATRDVTERDSSEDEILWKRVPEQPPWRRPKRRAYRDAFETEVDGENTGEELGPATRASKSRRKL